jgi:hypothetical protein
MSKSKSMSMIKIMSKSMIIKNYVTLTASKLQTSRQTPQRTQVS